MPGTVTASNAQQSPQIPPDADFGIVVAGCSTACPVAAGQVTPPYNSAAAAVGDLGLGDGVRTLTQGIVPRQSNPAPQGISFYQLNTGTLNTYGTAGVRGTTTPTVAGTCVVTNTASTHPVGTYQPTADVLVGGTIGTGPITIQFSLNNRRQFLPPVTITTAVTIKIQVSVGGVMKDTGVQYDLAAGTLLTGDSWSESKTTPPVFATADLYTAASGSTPASGLFAALANVQCGVVVIEPPVAAADFSTIVAGLNYLDTFNRRPSLLIRFRDQTSETDAAYILAFQTFAQACRDLRVTCVAGSGWLTDAFSQQVWLASGLPAVVARIQGNVAFPGQYGERLAKSPAYGADGRLPDFSVVDTNNMPITGAHDEAVRGGIDGPLNDGGGGGLTFFYNRATTPAGTYISQAPCLHAAADTVLTFMDARVANGIQRELVAVAWNEIQGSAVVNGGVLDPDLAASMAQKMRSAITAKFSTEFANPKDPNLVVVNPLVTVSGPNVSLTVSVNDKLFLYLNNITITLYNIRTGS